MGAASFVLNQLREHHAAWLDDLFKLSHNCHAPIHCRVRAVYFDYWGDTANLRNREVQTREQQAMTLISVF
jgi:hypothetical protein